MGIDAPSRSGTTRRRLAGCGRAPGVPGTAAGFRALPEKRRDHAAITAPNGAGPLRRLVLAACVLLSLVGLWPVAAQAQDVVNYISNVGQRKLGDREIGRNWERAQPFRTGSRSDRYSLQEVVLRLKDAGSGTLTVTIRENSAVSDSRCHDPGDIRYTLTNPDSLKADDLNTFTAPAGATLEPDTCYHIVAESAARIPSESSSWYRSDGVQANGWDIAFDYLNKLGNQSWRGETEIVHSWPGSGDVWSQR